MSEDAATARPAIRDYDDLRAAIAARRRELGLSQLETDHRAGTQDGYVGKIECGDRCLGDMSLQAILGALRLELLVRAYDPPANCTCRRSA